MTPTHNLPFTPADPEAYARIVKPVDPDKLLAWLEDRLSQPPDLDAESNEDIIKAIEDRRNAAWADIMDAIEAKRAAGEPVELRPSAGQDITA